MHKNRVSDKSDVGLELLLDLSLTSINQVSHESPLIQPGK